MLFQLRALAASVSLLCLGAAQAGGLEFRFNDAPARLYSAAVKKGEIDAATAESIRRLPETAAMVRKMRLKDADAFIEYLRGMGRDARQVELASQLQAEFANEKDGKFAVAAAETTRQLKAYLPPEFSAKLTVHFLFGGNAMGFAFDDMHDDVYVNLARFTQATAEELAEVVSHELFHAVQSHVMTAPPRPPAGMAQAATGKVWMNRLLYDLVQEATAELFSHPIADRPVTPFSKRGKERIARNLGRIKNIAALMETSSLRLLLAPPRDEDHYDRVYGILFYGDFDDMGYDMGWVMANAIERKDGKQAIYRLLQGEPKQFVLRYQQIAESDPALFRFNEDFLAAVRAL
ncbi:DUF5700 domain-containing putative Zn-dependent protease [Duganella sp. Root1480D1]|uniref:DUF5700 domain-containing putative Zn-dependent protease n=1 Tax=Duganella sp. Root1480D1 TaxID=1736471 RepID=UPI00070AF519|nr:DUF5700 domain-containing putative Zn-dependent protease [Duganella sp. Root1480D1]